MILGGLLLALALFQAAIVFNLLVEKNEQEMRIETTPIKIKVRD